MSRLPAPTSLSMSIQGGGLTEWNESQHNARIQSTASSLSALKNLKREIPQPGKPVETRTTTLSDFDKASQSDPKRKPLSDRALEYPSKTSLATGTGTSTFRSNMRPQSLAGMSSGVSSNCPLVAMAATTKEPRFLSSIGAYATCRGKPVLKPHFCCALQLGTHAQYVACPSRPPRRIGTDFSRYHRL
jgi:kinesin family protein C1